MYWSDWGNHPKIETAAMDGTLRETLVQDNIQWPTGERRRVPGGARGVAKALTGGVYNQLVLGTFGLGALSPVAGVCRGGREAALLATWSGRARGGLGGPYLTGVMCAPSGLAVDYHNERLYWADAKLSVIGSIRLNGTDPVVAIDNKKGEQHPRPARAGREERDLSRGNVPRVGSRHSPAPWGPWPGLCCRTDRSAEPGMLSRRQQGRVFLVKCSTAGPEPAGNAVPPTPSPSYRVGDPSLKSIQNP